MDQHARRGAFVEAVALESSRALAECDECDRHLGIEPGLVGDDFGFHVSRG